MTDVYQDLAEKLDHLPQGFPSTESGIELRILKKIFSPAEAAIALKLQPLPETAEAIAKRLDMPVKKTSTILDAMARKGQIGCRKMGGEQVYMFAAFIPGIYEFQVYRLDKELADMVEEYLPHVMKVVGGYEPGVARTVPVKKQIDPGIHLEKYEDIRELIENAQSFNLKDCICQKERRITGHHCSHTLERCLYISNEEQAFEHFLLGGRIISRAEALQVLENAEREGLVHNAFLNTKHGHAAICNCCSCCCAAIRSTKELGGPTAVARSNFVAVIDPETCDACGVCMENRCPMDAIAEKDGLYGVVRDTCIGCGVCTVTCPTDSIALIKRPSSEQTQPPDTVVEWMVARAANRGVSLG